MPVLLEIARPGAGDLDPGVIVTAGGGQQHGGDGDEGAVDHARQGQIGGLLIIALHLGGDVDLRGQALQFLPSPEPGGEGVVEGRVEDLEGDVREGEQGGRAEGDGGVRVVLQSGQEVLGLGDPVTPPLLVHPRRHDVAHPGVGGEGAFATDEVTEPLHVVGPPGGGDLPGAVADLVLLDLPAEQLGRLLPRLREELGANLTVGGVAEDALGLQIGLLDRQPGVGFEGDLPGGFVGAEVGGQVERPNVAGADEAGDVFLGDAVGEAFDLAPQPGPGAEQASLGIGVVEGTRGHGSGPVEPALDAPRAHVVLDRRLDAVDVGGAEHEGPRLERPFEALLLEGAVEPGVLGRQFHDRGQGLESRADGVGNAPGAGSGQGGGVKGGDEALPVEFGELAHPSGLRLGPPGPHRFAGQQPGDLLGERLDEGGLGIARFPDGFQLVLDQRLQLYPHRLAQDRQPGGLGHMLHQARVVELAGGGGEEEGVQQVLAPGGGRITLGPEPLDDRGSPLSHELGQGGFPKGLRVGSEFGGQFVGHAPGFEVGERLQEAKDGAVGGGKVLLHGTAGHGGGQAGRKDGSLYVGEGGGRGQSKGLRHGRDDVLPQRLSLRLGGLQRRREGGLERPGVAQQGRRQPLGGG